MDTTLQMTIPSGWKRVRLGDISDITNGKTNSQDATGDGMYPLFDRSVAIKKSSKYLFDKTAVILPGEGAEFVPRYYSGKFDLHQRAYAIFPNDSVHPVYLFQYLYANRAVFAQRAVGSTVKSLRLPIIQGVDILLPSLPEQKKISVILGTIDEVIQKTDEIIVATEKFKNSLTRELFTKGIGHKKFKKTEIGEIPAEWEIASLKNISTNLDNKRVPITKSKRDRGPYPYYGATGIVDHVNGYIFDEELLLISEDGANLKDRNYPIAFTAVGKYWVNNHAHIHRFENRFLQKYVQDYLNSINLELYLTGMAQPKLNKDRLFNIPIPKPRSTAEIQRIAEVLTATDEKTLLNQKLKDCLILLKKGLMQDLLSGKVRV